MGNSRSGNWGARPTVEACHTLDMNRLRRQGVIMPGCNTNGRYAWTVFSTSEQTASVDFETTLDERRGHMRLVYTSSACSTGETHAFDYSIQLVTTAQRCGGHRWWFCCPRTGLRVAKLHLPNGAFSFASRKAYRLGYRCQRETPNDRASNRAFKLRRKLGAEGGIGDVVFKPKGMHSDTFDRRLAKLHAAEAICDAQLDEFLSRLQGRCGVRGGSSSSV